MADIIHFPGGDEAIKEYARALLERIESGETTDVAWIEVRQDGTTATGYAGIGNYHPLHSGAWRLALRLCAEEDD